MRLKRLEVPAKLTLSLHTGPDFRRLRRFRARQPSSNISRSSVSQVVLGEEQSGDDGLPAGPLPAPTQPSRPSTWSNQRRFSSNTPPSSCYPFTPSAASSAVRQHSSSTRPGSTCGRGARSTHTRARNGGSGSCLCQSAGTCGMFRSEEPRDPTSFCAPVERFPSVCNFNGMLETSQVRQAASERARSFSCHRPAGSLAVLHRTTHTARLQLLTSAWLSQRCGQLVQRSARALAACSSSHSHPNPLVRMPSGRRGGPQQMSRMRKDRHVYRTADSPVVRAALVARLDTLTSLRCAPLLLPGSSFSCPSSAPSTVRLCTSRRPPSFRRSLALHSPTLPADPAHLSPHRCGQDPCRTQGRRDKGRQALDGACNCPSN